MAKRLLIILIQYKGDLRGSFSRGGFDPCIFPVEWDECGEVILFSLSFSKKTLNMSTLNIPDFIIHHFVIEDFQSCNLVENLWFAELDKIMDDDIWHPQKLKM